MIFMVDWLPCRRRCIAVSFCVCVGVFFASALSAGLTAFVNLRPVANDTLTR